MNQNQNNLNTNNSNNQMSQNNNISGYDSQSGNPIYGNQNNMSLNNNNKNTNNKLVIAIIVIIVLIAIILLLVRNIMWNNYVDEKYQEAEEQIMDDIDSIGDIDDIVPDDNDIVPDNDEKETIDISNYDDMIEYDASACGIGTSKKFILKDGNLIFVNLNTNQIYKVKNITNAKSIMLVHMGYTCDLFRYIILTNDGKVYYSSQTVSYIEDMQEFENEFKQVNSSYSFESLETSYNSEYNLVGKTTTGETVRLFGLLG